MLDKCNFIEQENGTFTIKPEIGIKLGDFGVAEVFQNDNFECHKEYLSLDNESKLAPEILTSRGSHSYNAQKVDTWSLGMILFE